MPSWWSDLTGYLYRFVASSYRQLCEPLSSTNAFIFFAHPHTPASTSSLSFSVPTPSGMVKKKPVEQVKRKDSPWFVVTVISRRMRDATCFLLNCVPAVSPTFEWAVLCGVCGSIFNWRISFVPLLPKHTCQESPVHSSTGYAFLARWRHSGLSTRKGASEERTRLRKCRNTWLKERRKSIALKFVEGEKKREERIKQT